MTPTELRKIAENAKYAFDNEGCALTVRQDAIVCEMVNALCAIAERDEKLRELVEKWRRSTPAESGGDSGVYCHGLHACADELSALLGE